jgi:cytochrome c-type biogenesis protein CcmH/NrfG
VPAPRLGGDSTQQAIRLQPDLAEAHAQLGRVMRALKRYDEARAAYLAALRLDPEHRAARQGLDELP